MVAIGGHIFFINETYFYIDGTCNLSFINIIYGLICYMPVFAIRDKPHYVNML